MNTTTHLALNMPELNDPVDITQLNHNMEVLDQKVYPNATVTGSYVGDGTQDRFINLGFTPRAVLLCSAAGRMGYYYNGSEFTYGGLFTADHPLMNSTVCAGQVQEGGFSVTHDSSVSSHCSYTNYRDMTFHYMAWPGA